MLIASVEGLLDAPTVKAARHLEKVAPCLNECAVLGLLYLWRTLNKIDGKKRILPCIFMATIFQFVEPFGVALSLALLKWLEPLYHSIRWYQMWSFKDMHVMQRQTHLIDFDPGKNASLLEDVNEWSSICSWLI